MGARFLEFRKALFADRVLPAEFKESIDTAGEKSISIFSISGRIERTANRQVRPVPAFHIELAFCLLSAQRTLQ